MLLPGRWRAVAVRGPLGFNGWIHTPNSTFQTNFHLWSFVTGHLTQKRTVERRPTETEALAIAEPIDFVMPGTRSSRTPLVQPVMFSIVDNYVDNSGGLTIRVDWLGD